MTSPSPAMTFVPAFCWGLFLYSAFLGFTSGRVLLSAEEEFSVPEVKRVCAELKMNEEACSRLIKAQKGNRARAFRNLLVSILLMIVTAGLFNRNNVARAFLVTICIFGGIYRGYLLIDTMQAFRLENSLYVKMKLAEQVAWLAIFLFVSKKFASAEIGKEFMRKHPQFR